jgi:hypothetical protein
MRSLGRNEDERPGRAAILVISNEDDVFAIEDVEGFGDPMVDVERRPEVGRLLRFK